LKSPLQTAEQEVGTLAISVKFVLAGVGILAHKLWHHKAKLS